jgi:hypothetical protein
MHNQVSMMNLLKGRLEALDQPVRQIRNEPHSIKHKTKLSIWQMKSLVGCVKCLEEEILALEVRTRTKVHQSRFPSIGVTYLYQNQIRKILSYQGN